MVIEAQPAWHSSAGVVGNLSAHALMAQHVSFTLLVPSVSLVSHHITPSWPLSLCSVRQGGNHSGFMGLALPEPDCLRWRNTCQQPLRVPYCLQCSLHAWAFLSAPTPSDASSDQSIDHDLLTLPFALMRDSASMHIFALASHASHLHVFAFSLVSAPGTTLGTAHCPVLGHDLGVCFCPVLRRWP
jgi:hypothetical protein